MDFLQYGVTLVSRTLEWYNYMQNWFPLGLASGEAFCNRIDERKHLKHNILHGIHTLIASPRRYGKTSLAQQIIQDINLSSALMEFTLASDLVTTQNIISIAIGKLVLDLAPNHKKAFVLANKFFSKLNPKLIIDTHMGATIELTPEFQSPHLGIMDLLQNVDNAAKAANKKIVLFMDEFQQIALLEDHLQLEAAIRNAAQRMKNTSIIFSGSNRHLLQLMFDDNSRPLYHLCDRINLQRIHANDYESYIQKVALKRWHRKLEPESINEIFAFTYRHPYYVNVLCGRLYRYDTLPTLIDIQSCWHEYITEENDRIGKEISQLSHYQKMMLILLSISPFSQPSSKEVTQKIHTSTSNAAKCCKFLLENDYVYKDSNGVFRITDPAIESYLKKYAILLT